MTESPDQFSTETKGLPGARSVEVLELADGDHFDLRIAPVAKRLGDTTVRMLTYNGSVQGPTLGVRQGSKLIVNVVNDGDLEATVHWHGLRLENRYDGTAETQRPIPIGGCFTYQLDFPDPGIYWYHPHIREDYNQEMGLYGSIVVAPSEQDYWPPANREVALMVDDILLEEGNVAPFRRSLPTYSAMGRFGNILLVNGEPDLSVAVQRDEVVRFYLTNTANTRVFNVAIPGAQMKLVGGDSGHVEREALVENVVIAPSERAVVDVFFAVPGKLSIEHRTPKRTYTLASVTVFDQAVTPLLKRDFGSLRTNSDMAAIREQVAPFLETEPDKTLSLVAVMDMGTPDAPPAGTLVYLCPMHPDVKSEKADRCPKCGMKLVPAQLVSAALGHPHSETPRVDEDVSQAHQHGNGEHAHEAGGIEWEDDMVDVNRMTTPENTHWKLVDQKTGAEGAAIDWQFRIGDQVKIRIVNEMDSDHPMHHPFHIHGAGRFLILARDGDIERNLVWKDTVLVPTGQAVDILLDVTNPGRWMAHCHIAEHHESGMMFSFTVNP